MDNLCGVHVWWDDDKSLRDLPWSRANLSDPDGKRPAAMLSENEFRGDEVALHLRSLDRPVLLARNIFHEAKENMRIEGDSTVADDPADFRFIEKSVPQRQEILGTRDMRGQRADLAGRKNIIMTEWGPWDHASPLLQFMEHFDSADVYRLRGATVMPTAGQIRVEGNANARVERDMIAILPRQKDTVTPYHMEVEVAGHALRASGVLTGGQWRVMTFPSAVDPRGNAEQWREKGIANARRPPVDKLDLRFGSGGMAEALGLAPMEFPRDHFGIIATNTLTFPPGQWRITTTSDDGIRVWMDEKLIIDDWTHHAPKKHTHDFEVTEPREVKFRVEYFELDGHAVLSLGIARAP
jgi:hypothetical protein